MDVPELAKVRELLVDKYTASILPDREIGVYPRLVLKLAMSNPERGLCEKYLEAIADSFGIGWASGQDEDEGGTGLEREEALLSLLSSTSSQSLPSVDPPKSDLEPQQDAQQPKPQQPTSAPLPMDYSKQQQQQQQQQQRPPHPRQTLPDFDEFTRRFEALRKK